MKFIFIICIALILFSCDPVATKEFKATKKLEDAKAALEETHINQLFIEITKTNNVSCLWDTVNYSYSLSYSKILISENQLINNFKLLDVYKKNELYYLFICVNYNSWYTRMFYFELTATKPMYIEFCKKKSPVLLVKITDIRKMRWKIGIESDGIYNGVEPSLVLEHSPHFIGNGKLTGVYDFGKEYRKIGFDIFEEGIIY